MCGVQHAAVHNKCVSCAARCCTPHTHNAADRAQHALWPQQGPLQEHYSTHTLLAHKQWASIPRLKRETIHPSIRAPQGPLFQNLLLKRQWPLLPITRLPSTTLPVNRQPCSCECSRPIIPAGCVSAPCRPNPASRRPPPRRLPSCQPGWAAPCRSSSPGGEVHGFQGMGFVGAGACIPEVPANSAILSRACWDQVLARCVILSLSQPQPAMQDAPASPVHDCTGALQGQGDSLYIHSE